MEGTEVGLLGKVGGLTMAKAITRYNAKVPNGAWKVNQGEKSFMISLSKCPGEVWLLLERRFSRFRRDEAALTLELLTTIQFIPGESRMPDSVDEPKVRAVWCPILEVGCEVTVAFVHCSA